MIKKKNFIGAAGAAAVGAAILGPIGLAAGALAGGNLKKVTYGLEMKDGKKVVFEVERGNDKVFQCIYLYARENGLIEIDF